MRDLIAELTVKLPKEVNGLPVRVYLPGPDWDCYAVVVGFEHSWKCRFYVGIKAVSAKINTQPFIDLILNYLKTSARNVKYRMTHYPNGPVSKAPTAKPKCTCGVASLGGGVHSSWCDVA